MDRFMKPHEANLLGVCGDKYVLQPPSSML